jgi:hypothetical protein
MVFRYTTYKPGGMTGVGGAGVLVGRVGSAFAVTVGEIGRAGFVRPSGGEVGVILMDAAWVGAEMLGRRGEEHPARARSNTHGTTAGAITDFTFFSWAQLLRVV